MQERRFFSSFRTTAPYCCQDSFALSGTDWRTPPIREIKTCLLPRPWGPTSRFQLRARAKNSTVPAFSLEIMSITCSSFVNPMRPAATHGRNIQHTPAIKKTHPVCPACNSSSSCCCILRPSLLPFPHQAFLVNFPRPFLSLSDPSSSLTRPPCIGTNHVVDFYFSSLFLSSQCPASASQL
jgi:hypothetical protein